MEGEELLRKMAERFPEHFMPYTGEDEPPGFEPEEYPLYEEDTTQQLAPVWRLDFDTQWTTVRMGELHTGDTFRVAGIKDRLLADEEPYINPNGVWTIIAHAIE